MIRTMAIAVICFVIVLGIGIFSIIVFWITMMKIIIKLHKILKWAEKRNTRNR